MSFNAEMRLSPRITTNSLVGLPHDSEGALVNISDSGICFEHDGAELDSKFILSMNLSTLKSERISQFPAEVVWRNSVGKNKTQCGARLRLSEKQANELKDFIFNLSADKACTFIKDEKKDVVTKVENFFAKDVRKFHEDMTILAQEAARKKVDSDEGEQRVTKLINDLLLKGNDLEKIVSDERGMKKIKQLFRELTGCWYYKSPILKMANDKPQGYPGDYKLFDIIYDKQPLAEPGTMGYFWDNYFLNNGYANAARARKNKMKNILQDLIENSDLKSVKLLNVACGPSREIRELLCDPYLASRKKLVFTGLDNDKDSLDFSQSKFKSLPPNFQVRLIKENVLKLFKDKKYNDLIGKQDIIYILGLTEYLPDRIFRSLTKFLFELLNEKGMLVITYKDEAIEFPSLPPEWLCDWAFIKRTKDDLIETTKQLGSDKFTLKIEREGTGTIFFLILTKT